MGDCEIILIGKGWNKQATRKKYLFWQYKLGTVDYTWSQWASSGPWAKWSRMKEPF